MCVEERSDATAGIEGGWFVVGDIDETQDLEENALVVVHERMPGFGVFSYVVRDQGAFGRALELVGYASVPTVLGPVAGDDGTGGNQEAIDVGGSSMRPDAAARAAAPSEDCSTCWTSPFTWTPAASGKYPKRVR